MIKTDEVEIWNLTENGVARSGCVDIFNIVGRLRKPSAVRRFYYTLNDGPPTPIYVATKMSRAARLWHPGEFNIDTINAHDLRRDNLLRLFVATDDGEKCQTIPFVSQPFDSSTPSFELDLSGIGSPEQVGQIVEGPWTVGRDGDGRNCLEIREDDAGYDRIILFGHRDWTTGYEIRARLSVTRIIGRHNIGLIFKWNPHEQGDGTWLPKKWSTGLGYYSSYDEVPGIRIRFGVGVHTDAGGKKTGSHVLAQAPFGPPQRRLVNAIKRRIGLLRWTTDLTLRQEYCFRMKVDPMRYSLAVWEARHAEPAPQLVVDQPKERLSQGAVGILAYQVGVRLYELAVRPLQP